MSRRRRPPRWRARCGSTAETAARVERAYERAQEFRLEPYSRTRHQYNSDAYAALRRHPRQQPHQRRRLNRRVKARLTPRPRSGAQRCAPPLIAQQAPHRRAQRAPVTEGHEHAASSPPTRSPIAPTVDPTTGTPQAIASKIAHGTASAPDGSASRSACWRKSINSGSPGPRRWTRRPGRGATSAGVTASTSTVVPRSSPSAASRSSPPLSAKRPPTNRIRGSARGRRARGPESARSRPGWWTATVARGATREHGVADPFRPCQDECRLRERPSLGREARHQLGPRQHAPVRRQTGIAAQSPRSRRPRARSARAPSPRRAQRHRVADGRARRRAPRAISWAQRAARAHRLHGVPASGAQVESRARPARASTRRGRRAQRPCGSSDAKRASSSGMSVV